MSKAAIKLYGFPLSGHSHRVALALSLLGLDYEEHNLDLKAGEQKEDWFRALNPFGKVPVLLDGDTAMYESTAILAYLAAKYDDGTWYPQDPVSAAEIEKWFVVSSTKLLEGPAYARLITVFGAGFNQEVTIEKAHEFLRYLESSLKGKNYLLGASPTFADVAIYTYTAHAPEGLVSLEPYAEVRRWISNIEKLDGFIAMQKTEVASAA